MTEASIMRELGSTFAIPCGVSLGPISLTKGYNIRWQLILPTNPESFIAIEECSHTDPDTQDTPESLVELDCSSDRYSIDLKNFSLTVFQFDTSGLVIDPSVPQVKYRCIVSQTLQPTFGNTKTEKFDTVVSFRFGKKITLFHVYKQLYLHDEAMTQVYY